jgi:medium-chain acyl-[acyl-carrier-protein] hydrolase
MSVFAILPGSPKVFSENFTIRSYHTDLHRRLTIPKLCSFFQDIAGNHTVACGVGWEVMQEQKVFWVLSRLKIDVVSFPVWRQKIKVSTWSMGTDGLFAYRNFRVEDENGDVLVKASSMWLMVNTETRRLVRPGDYMRDFPLCSDRILDEDPEKIPALKEPMLFDSAKVSFTETDMNLHMNNICYIERIINTYEFQFLMENQISGFEINFLKEAVPGDWLKAGSEKVSDCEFLNNIVRDDGVEMVRTRMRWNASPTPTK